MDGWKLGKWLVIEVCFSSKNARQKQEKKSFESNKEAGFACLGVNPVGKLPPD